jgi:hypothetical protein
MVAHNPTLPKPPEAPEVHRNLFGYTLGFLAFVAAVITLIVVIFR